VWKEELRIRAISTTDYERRKATREKKTGIMKDERRGKRLKRYEDGWTDHKREYYQQLLGILKTSSQVMYGIHYKIIGKCNRRKSTTKGMIIKMMM
jgi:hypothetical protein